MYQIGTLKPKYGAKKTKIRVGRGLSAGRGKTCGRGHKGQNSRTGGGSRPGFEGGQNPIYRRFPKEKGFKNLTFTRKFRVLNLEDINKLNGDISPETLVKAGLAKNNDLIKILGKGKIEKALNVSAHAFSASAKEAIEKTGGKVITCPIS